MRSWLSSFFREEQEHSLRLRMITLAITWCAAAALALIGAAPWAWAGTALLATGGHACSWRYRHRKFPVFRGLVIVGVLGVTALLAVELPRALEGNWLPPAQFLGLTMAVASFDLRTRGSLYTIMLLAGTIAFLASQLAFGAAFIVVLVTFFMLFLAFLAMATVIDGSKDATGAATWKLPARGLAWTSWGVGVMTLGIAIFLVVPWGTLRSGVGLGGAEAQLPLTGDVSAATGSAGPSTPPSIDPLGGATPPQADPSLTDPVGGANPAGSPATGGQGSAPGAAGPGGQPVGGAFGAPATTAGPLPDDVVLRVRSPVASYWRNEVYSSFLNGNWIPDTASPVSEGPGLGIRGQYSQTFYVAEDQAAPALGYSALRWNVISGGGEGGVLDEGTVYQGISQRRPFTEGALRFVSEGFRPASPPASVPPSIVLMAEDVAGAEQNLLDRSLALTQFLRDNYTLDPDLPNTAPSQSVEQFLLGDQRVGSSFDFAAAHALLARGAGLEARMVTGFLPGEFDPLSGAFTVRSRDTHAWAEVRYPFLGWVPFDASPRGDLPLADGAGGFASLIDRVFDAQLGDEVKDGFGDVLAWLQGSRAFTIGGALFGMYSLAVWWFIRYTRDKRRARGRAIAYSGLSDRGHVSIRKSFRNVERMLSKSGVDPRRKEESLEAYFQRAESHVGQGSLLTHLRNAFQGATYQRAAPSGNAVTLIHDLSRRLRASAG